MGLIVDDPRNLRRPREAQTYGLGAGFPTDAGDEALYDAGQLQRRGDELVGEPTAETRTLIENCRHDHEALQDYRERRQQARDDYRGYQWEGQMTDPDDPDSTISEKTYLEREGRQALVMNHIAPTIRNLKGQLLQNRSERMAYAVDKDDQEAANQMSVALRATRRQNQLPILEADQFEEHVLGGLHAWKATGRYVPESDRDEVAVDSVPPYTLFFNSDFGDRRMKGLRRIGEIHEVHLDELCAKIAESPAHEERLREIYADRDRKLEQPGLNGFDRADQHSNAFYNPADPDKARLIEVWYTKYKWVRRVHDPATGAYQKLDVTPEDVAAVNEERTAMGMPPLDIDEEKETVWCWAFLSPEGHLLAEGETPYWHGSHPYCVSFASLIDGEWWGLVDDIQDPQKLINRITAAIDFMLAASAKGVLLVDEETLVDSDMTLDDVAEEWTRFNGVIALKPKAGRTIGQSMQQVTASSIPAGIFEWLGAQKSWVEELSGVMGPQLGKKPQAGTPASLYAQQQVQASLTTLIFFDTFFQGLYELDRKTLQLVLQFYDDERVISPGARDQLVRYQPDRVRDISWDVVVADAADTATFRMQFEQSLMEFLGAGHLTFSQFLDVSSHPKARQLQRIIERTNPLITGGQGQPSSLDTAPPELAGAMMQAAQSGDVDAGTLLAQAQDYPAQAQALAQQMGQAGPVQGAAPPMGDGQAGGSTPPGQLPTLQQ